MFIETQRQKITALYNDYPPKFWTLLAITFVDRLGGSLLFPFFALYLTKRFNVGMTQVGLLFLVWSLTSFVGSMLGGALTDRFGRKWIVIFSLVSTSFSSVVMGLVGSLQAFFVLALVVGVFTEVGGPAYQAMVADLLPAEKRAQGYGLFRVTFNLSIVIGPAIGGFLATRSYLLLFISDAVISLISAVLVAVYLPETKPEAIEGAEPESVAGTFAGYIQVLHDRVFMLFLLTCMLMVFVYMNMNTTLGVYLRDVHGVPESGYGLILSLNALMVVLFQFPITRRIEGKPQMLMMALGMALYTIGFSMYGLVSIYPLFLLAMVIITIGEMLVAPVSQALTAQLAPEDMRGRYMAVFGVSWGLPFAIGPILAGLVMDKLNPTWLWYIAGLLGIMATSGFLGLHRLVGEQLVNAEATAAGD